MYVLGLDLGTSSLKALLMNKSGEVVQTATADYPLITPKPGYSEQDPQEWLNAAKKVIEELKTKVADFEDTLEGISFSGQMHSLVLLDENDKVLRNAILWNDTRTTAQCEKIMATVKNIVDITKNIALEGFTLPKILWVKENEPEIWAKTKHFLLPKDYLAYFLTGNKSMDYSDAAGTLMLDINKKDWSSEIREAFELNKEIYPKLLESTSLVGTLKAEFGFKKEVKVFAGGADNACAAVGAGIVKPGIGMASIGTSGVFATYEDKVRSYGGKLHFFNHAAENSHYSMGVTLSAGHSLSWFRDTFSKGEDFKNLLEGINELESSLIFTPYIVGERTPHVDSKIRGSFIGIDTTHTIKHFAKAILEGITFSLKDSQIIMEEAKGEKFKTIISVGGGAKNSDWLQMQADIFNADIQTLTVEQGPGLGAAMLAAVGCGWFENIASCAEKFVSYGDIIKPNSESVKKYERLYAEYKKVYGNTKEICHSLSL
ncbi:MAG: xylulokinase [Defluviitaleaceae bacterium]|nr:xylulokinase [Defluviitaleaceae bacterium]